MMYANEELIRRLLSDEDVVQAHIAKATGIPHNTISNLRQGKAAIEEMRLRNAAALTAFAEDYYKPKRGRKKKPAEKE